MGRTTDILAIRANTVTLRTTKSTSSACSFPPLPIEVLSRALCARAVAYSTAMSCASIRVSPLAMKCSNLYMMRSSHGYSKD